MDDIATTIEALESQLMRAWMSQDEREVRKLLMKDCIITIGSSPMAILDRPSFVRAVPSGLRCLGFRFREIAVRRYGKFAWFVGKSEMELALGRQRIKGDFLISDMWQRSKFRRTWVLAERSLAPLAEQTELAADIRKLQLWH